MMLFLLGFAICATLLPLPSAGLEVGIYYESKCPASQKWISEQLLPLLKAVGPSSLMRAKVAIHPVPYGNTEESLGPNGMHTFVCQNGPVECFLNRVEACGLRIIGESKTDVWAPWVDCVNRSSFNKENMEKALLLFQEGLAHARVAIAEAMMGRAAAAAAAALAKEGKKEEAAREAMHASQLFSKALNDAMLAMKYMHECVEQLGDGTKDAYTKCPLNAFPYPRLMLVGITACTLSPWGERLQHSMGEETPAHEYVPWITFDKIHTPDAEKDFACVFCQLLNDNSNPQITKFCKGKESCAMLPHIPLAYQHTPHTLHSNFAQEAKDQIIASPSEPLEM